MKKKRLCLFCSRAEAQFLNAAHIVGEPGVFCSRDCAAAFAIGTVSKERIIFCETHGTWTEKKGVCLLCQAKEQGYGTLLTLKPMPSEAAGKGVTHAE